MTSHQTPAREALYAALSGMHLSPLWQSLHTLVPPHPTAPYAAALWRYADIAPQLARAK